MDKWSECKWCGSNRIKQSTETLPYTFHVSEVFECCDCHATIRQVRNDEGPVAGLPESVWKPAATKTKNRFAGRSRRDLGEIGIALELLSEYPETRDCLRPLQDDLQEALVSGE